ncbi:MAG: DUF637 domain-containing protein [Alphaproteobacteria bacterium]|nr:DUF637 domain-containing protein [Alphaproteobacteria bacterium]
MQQEFHKHWNHKQSGLTPGGAAIIALAVAIATAGAGSAVSAGVAGAASSAGMSTAMAGLMGAMSKAAFMSLVSTASVSLVNNKGDFGKVFAELASKEQMRSLAVAVATAGLTHGVGGALDIPASTDSVGARMQNVAVQRGAQTVAETVIYGDDFGNAVQRNAIGGFVDFGAGLAAQEIGEMYHGNPEEASLSEEAGSKQDKHIDYVTHKIAHGVVGGTAGYILEGKKGVIGGAIGSVASEMTAEALGQNIAEEALQEAQSKADREGRPFDRAEYQQILSHKIEMVQHLSELSSSGVSLLTGQDVDMSVQTAQNATANNWVKGALLLGGLALTAYEVGTAYKEGGPEAAADVLILEGVITVVGGATFKVAGKVYPSAVLAFEAARLEYPALQKVTTSVSSKTIEPSKALLNSAHTVAVSVVEKVVESKAGQKIIQKTGALKGAVEEAAVVKYGRSALESVTEGLQKVGLVKAEQAAVHQLEKTLLQNR